MIAKVALWLQGSERDMTEYANLTREFGTITVTYGDTKYAIVPKVEGQELSSPGINITFLDEADASPDRNKNKRFIQPVIIRITRPVEAGHNIYALEEQALVIIDKVQECFSDGFLEVWDYTDVNSPIFTGVRGTWKDSGVPATNDSFAVSGGDITYSITMFIEYVNLNYS
jgi:hypothetical protein